MELNGMVEFIVLSLIWIGVSSAEGTNNICWPLVPQYSSSQQWDCLKVSQISASVSKIEYPTNVSKSVLTSFGIDLSSTICLQYPALTRRQVLNLYLIGDAYGSFFQFLFWLENAQTYLENIHLNAEEAYKSFNSTLFKIVFREVGYHALLHFESFGRDYVSSSKYFDFLTKVPFEVYNAIRKAERPGTFESLSELKNNVREQFDEVFPLPTSSSTLIKTLWLKTINALSTVLIDIKELERDVFTPLSLIYALNCDEFDNQASFSLCEPSFSPEYPSSMFSDLNDTLCKTLNTIFDLVQNFSDIENSSPGLSHAVVQYFTDEFYQHSGTDIVEKLTTAKTSDDNHEDESTEKGHDSPESNKTFQSSSTTAAAMTAEKDINENKDVTEGDDEGTDKKETIITTSETKRTTSILSVGGTNGKDQTTGKQGEDPPGQEYRASYHPSHELPIVLRGDGNEASVDLTISSTTRTGFEGVTQDHVRINITNKRSFRGEARITMTVKSVNASFMTLTASADASAAWIFTVTIQGQIILNGQSTDPLRVDLKVEHGAPTCPVHRFTDSGNAIKFEFNVPVNVTRSTDGNCGDFFEDVSALGGGAKCDMLTLWLLVVTIGKQTDLTTDLITPGDLLTFKPNTINPARQMFYKSMPTQSISIEKPLVPQKVSFNIAGPSKINKCGSYQLRAQQIVGHGGRPVTYRWQLRQATDEVKFNFVEERNGLNEGQGSPELPLNATDLQPGQRYEFSLEITNFIGESGLREHTLFVNEDIKPIIEIKPVNVIPQRVRVSSRVKLEAVVTYSFGDDCQSNENEASYIWSDSEGVITEDLRFDRILVLPPNTLPVGRNISVRVTVRSTGASGESAVTETIQLTTVASPLVAKIAGASILTLGKDDDVTLDGSLSHDPNEKDPKLLTFQWACVVISSSGNSCDEKLDLPVTPSELSIKSSRFTAGTYSFTLTVSKGTSAANASVTVIIENDNVPVISIKTVEGKTKYRHDRSIYIQANVKSPSNVTIAWRETNDRLQPERSSLVKRQNEFITHVKIPHDQTTPGSQYTIEVIATDENGKTGLATLNLKIYNPITQCVVHATPYKELGEITITATGCVADPDLEPLTYQPVFALPVESGFKKIVLGGSKSDSEQKVIASPINYNEGQVYVGFMICDASLTCIDELRITEYIPAEEITPSEQQEYITHNVDEVLERGDIATAFRNVINIANLLKKTSLPTRRRRQDINVQFTFQGNLDSVFLVVNDQTVQVNGNDAETQFKIELAGKQAMVFFSVRPVDVNEGALVSDLSSQMLISMFTEEEIDEVLRTIRRILDKARDEGALYSKDTIERLLTTLKMSEENMRSNGRETKERRKTARNLREMALKQAGQHLNIDEHVTFDVLGTQMFVAYSFPKHEVTLTNDSVHRVNARLGRNLSNSYGYDWCGNSQSETCVGIKVMATQMDSLEEKINNCTDIFRVGLLNPVTDEQLSDLEEPIEIEMAMNQVGKDERCVCKCWNEDTSQLEDDGVTSETTADGKLICKSRRPATFVGARELNSSADRQEGRQRAGIPKLQKRHPGVILGIVFGILLLIIVAVAIAVMVLKANAKKKVSPAGKKFEEEKSDISEADNP